MNTVVLWWHRERGARPLLAVVLAAVVVAAGLSACSDSGTAEGLPKVRTVTMVMKEMSFTPDVVRVKVGEVVRFRFVNKGTVRHEAVIGDQAAQDKVVELMREMDAATSTTTMTTEAAGAAHRRGGDTVELVAAQVRRHPGMGLPNLVSVEPGRTGELTFSFASPGDLLIGCHEAGHYESGMYAKLIVSP